MEESPSPVMSEKLRKTMGEAAVNAAKALHYDNAGTVEFIYDDKNQRILLFRSEYQTASRAPRYRSYNRTRLGENAN